MKGTWRLVADITVRVEFMYSKIKHACTSINCYGRNLVEFVRFVDFILNTPILRAFTCTIIKKYLIVSVFGRPDPNTLGSCER